MRILSSLFVSSLLALSLNANKITIGAVPVPHSEILEVAKPILLKHGYELEIREIDDKILNHSLASGDIDANFYQHEPYLQEFNKANNTELSSIIKVHIEPMAVYSKKIKNLDNIKTNGKISLPNDPINEHRALLLLERQGLIKLAKKELLSIQDIVENPKNIEFVTLQAATLPRSIDDVDASVISTSYALAGGLNPSKDGIYIESAQSPYVNIIVARTKDKDDEKFVALKKAILSNEVREFILKTYNGAVLPVF